MTTEAPGIERNCAWITVLIMTVIAYGSLYPFLFQANETAIGPLRALLSTWKTPSGRYDVIANVLFYLPFGFFAVRSIRLRPIAARAALILLAGAALSLSMELLQFYDAGRVSCMSDVYANTAGTLLGAMAGAFLASRLPTPELRALGTHPFVLLLLMCWFGARLFPYVPAIDLHKYRTALEPLVFWPTFSTVDVYRHLARWLAVAALLEALCDFRWGRLAIVPVVPGVLFARVLIDGLRLSPAEVAGGSLAVLIWSLGLSRMRARAVIVMGMFATSVVVAGLTPFQFETTGRSLQWIPFLGLLESSFYFAVPSFFEKAFTGGALVWLMVRGGLRWIRATILGAVLVLAVSLAQTHLAGRRADLTDVLLLVLSAVAMQLTGEPQRDAEPVRRTA